MRIDLESEGVRLLAALCGMCSLGLIVAGGAGVALAAISVIVTWWLLA